MVKKWATTKGKDFARVSAHIRLLIQFTYIYTYTFTYYSYDNKDLIFGENIRNIS